MKNRSDKSYLTFCSIIHPGTNHEVDALLLAESIRAFAGCFANAPIWFMLPINGKQISERTSKRLQELNVQLIPINLSPGADDFFFSVEMAALDQVEKLAANQVSYLVWLDSNTILLNEPGDLVLKDSKKLAFKPVHWLLIGSDFDQPIDPFWQHIYQFCRVPQERLFPMHPIVQDIRMRPYFNAGLLVIRPEQGLLHNWHSKFMEIYLHPIFQEFYQKDPRYEIFMHQAVLSGIILNHFNPNELYELPDSYNYPLHLWVEDKTVLRPANLNNAVTIRHEGFYLNKDWETQIPLSLERIQWLKNKLKQMSVGEL